MAPKRFSKEEIAGRLRTIRMELFGEHGAPLLAESLNVRTRTWLAYEEGELSLPATIFYLLIEATSANPRWVMEGAGEKYRDPSAPDGW